MIVQSLLLAFSLVSIANASKIGRSRSALRRSMSFDPKHLPFIEQPEPDIRQRYNPEMIVPEKFMEALKQADHHDIRILRNIENGLHPTSMNEFRDPDGNTFLMIAIERELFEIIVELLNLDADPRISNNKGWNAIHKAAAQKDPIYLKVVLTFLKSDDIALNAANKDGNTPLIIAVLNRHFKNTKNLLGFSPTVVNGINEHGIKGYTPLIIATRKCSVRMINLLLSFGASVTERDSSGKSVISYALESKSPLQIYNLINPSNANVIKQEARARATVSKAIQSGSIEWLLFYAQDLGMDLNFQESISESEHAISPLTRAVILGHVYLVQFLLACGVYVDPVDGLGNTPLMYALKRGGGSMASYLLDYGANLNFLNPLTNERAISIAQSYGDEFMTSITPNNLEQ